MALLTPDFYLTGVLAITKEGLDRYGYRALLLDADNTMLPRDGSEVPAEVVDWVHRMVDAGVEVMILSNSWHDRVVDLAANLGLPLERNAWKPLPQGFVRASRRLAAGKRQTLVVGDQLFTDVLGSKLWGYDVAKVVPIVEYDLPHTRFLRIFERPLMGSLVPTDRLAPVQKRRRQSAVP